MKVIYTRTETLEVKVEPNVLSRYLDLRENPVVNERVPVGAMKVLKRKMSDWSVKAVPDPAPMYQRFGWHSDHAQEVANEVLNEGIEAQHRAETRSETRRRRATRKVK